MGKVIRMNNRLHHLKLPLLEELPYVPLISMFPGSDGRFIRYAIDSGAKGLVVEAVGAGNVNAEMFKAIKYALGKKIPVVITSTVPHGGVWPMYSDVGGGAMLEKEGAILGGYLRGQKARLLLMLAIPQTNGDVNRIKAYFAES